MALRVESELHRRRSGRNVGLALVLTAFAALVFGLSVVKIKQGDLMHAYDHSPRSVLPDPAAPGATAGPAANPVAVPGTPGAALPNAQPAPAARVTP